MRWWWVLVPVFMAAVGYANPDPNPRTDLPTAPDSTGTVRESYWGPIPAANDSNTVQLENPPTPTWEHVANAPYNLVGIPFRLGNLVVRETVETLDGWGLFDLPPVSEKGLPLPGGFLLMPDGGYSSLLGWQAGFNIRHPHFLGKSHKAYLTLETSTRHADKLGGGFRFQLDDKWALDLGGGGADIPLARYFGHGYDTVGGRESYYNRISHWGGLDVTRQLGRHTHTRLRSYFSHVEAKDSRFEVDLGLRRIHGGDLPDGFPGKSSGVTVQVDWFLDSALVDGRPTVGTFKRLAVAWFQETDGSDLRFLQYTFDMQRFLPLWHTKRALALRAYGSRILPYGEDPVPLSRQVSTYRPYSMRGIESHRYYGLGVVGGSAEYRWPIWVVKGRSESGLDAYLFTDTGQIFDRGRELAWDRFVWTGGFGFRLMGGDDDLVANLEIGFSDEGTQFQIGVSQSFQFAGKGMMYGKDPTHRP